jgi:hypothetical protein
VEESPHSKPRYSAVAVSLDATSTSTLTCLIRVGHQITSSAAVVPTSAPGQQPTTTTATTNKSPTATATNTLQVTKSTALHDNPVTTTKRRQSRAGCQVSTNRSKLTEQLDNLRHDRVRDTEQGQGSGRIGSLVLGRIRTHSDHSMHFRRSISHCPCYSY